MGRPHRSLGLTSSPWTEPMCAVDNAAAMSWLAPVKTALTNGSTRLAMQGHLKPQPGTATPLTTWRGRGDKVTCARCHSKARVMEGKVELNEKLRARCQLQGSMDLRTFFG